MSGWSSSKCCNFTFLDITQFYEKVGNGWCLDKKHKRINEDKISWINTKVRAGGGSNECENECVLSPKCIGYMTEDETKCDLLVNTDKNAENGIHAVDSETRNNCWKKNLTGNKCYYTITFANFMNMHLSRSKW